MSTFFSLLTDSYLFQPFFFVWFVSALSRRNPGRDFCQRIYSFKRCLRYSGIRGGGRNGELGKQHTDRNKNYVSRALTLVIGTHTGFSVSFEVASGWAAAAAVQTVVEEGGLGRLWQLKDCFKSRKVGAHLKIVAPLSKRFVGKSCYNLFSSMPGGSGRFGTRINLLVKASFC